MYEFKPYDPATPHMVTSFKGRAETWDNDTQGISKGEHNHEPEHEVAELEHFKSQLILAAIASPTSMLNDLIDQAAGYMSQGVTFGSRESLKKSLTVARKSAENGGFKMKTYKNSDSSAARNAAAAAGANNLNNQETKSLVKNEITDLFPADMKLFDNNGTMLSLLSLARQCHQQQEAQQNGKNQDNGVAAAAAAAAAAILLNNSNMNGTHQVDSLNHNNDQSTSNNSSALLNHFSTLNQSLNNNLLKANGGSNSSTTSSSDFLMENMDVMLGDFIGNSKTRLDTSGLMSSASTPPNPASSPFNDSGICLSTNPPSGTKRKHTLSTSNIANMSYSAQMNALKQQQNNSSSGRTTPNFMQKQQKTARVNDIFNKLSTKAQKNAACTSTASSVNNNNYQFNQFAALCSAQLQQNQELASNLFDVKQQKLFLNHVNQLNNNNTTKSSNDDNNNKHLNNIGTQTDLLQFDSDGDGEIRLSSCIGTSKLTNGISSTCGCRIIKVCCCGEETCLRNSSSGRSGGASSV